MDVRRSKYDLETTLEKPYVSNAPNYDVKTKVYDLYTSCCKDQIESLKVMLLLLSYILSRS